MTVHRRRFYWGYWWAVHLRWWWADARLLLRRTVAEFGDDHCPQLAASISYYVLFSVFPLAILVVAVAGLILTDTTIRRDVTDQLFDALPLSEGEGRADLENAIDGVATGFSALGLLSLLGLLWSASGMMGALRFALNQAWDTEYRRPLLRGKLVDLGMVLGVGGLITLSVSSTIFLQVARRVSTDLSGVLGPLGAGATLGFEVVAVLVPLGLSFAIFLVVFKYVPAVQTRFRYVWPGAFVAAIGFEVLKNGFAIYLQNFGNYDAVYGSLGAVIAFLFFVYLSALVLLFGAEMAAEWPRVIHGHYDAQIAAAQARAEGSRRRRLQSGLVGLMRSEQPSPQHIEDASGRAARDARKAEQLQARAHQRGGPPPEVRENGGSSDNAAKAGDQHAEASAIPEQTANALAREGAVALPAQPIFSPTRIDGVIFDLDGVVTDTTPTHAAAWAQTFDAFLQRRAQTRGEPFVPFDRAADYLRYLDGRLRLDGVRAFLAARDIALPEGDPDDPPDRESVWGLGNHKNADFLARLQQHPPRPFPATVALLAHLRAHRFRLALISSSRTAHAIIQAVGLADRFETIVDGSESAALGLPGKPDPAIFVEAAARLGSPPGRVVVAEDAQAGVAAARRGRFGLVIGIDRAGQAAALREQGADVVVADLAELTDPALTAALEAAGEQPISSLPSALAGDAEWRRRLAGRRPALFLDYDGTLTPIVARPEGALLPPQTRESLAALAGRLPIAILSGRDVEVVRDFVGLDRLYYAGSHGFEIIGPNGWRYRHPDADEFLPALDRAERALRSALSAITGAQMERKRFTLAIHYRNVADSAVPLVEAAVRATREGEPRLRLTDGKKVFELRPALDWDKGRALHFLRETLGLDRADSVPLYIGDDETDEDAFRAVRGFGLAFVVAGEVERYSAAQAVFTDTEEVRAFLASLATEVTESR